MKLTDKNLLNPIGQLILLHTDIRTDIVSAINELVDSGGNSTGVNGLNGDISIGLGGDLQNDTTINADGHQVTIQDNDDNNNRSLIFNPENVQISYQKLSTHKTAQFAINPLGARGTASDDSSGNGASIDITSSDVYLQYNDGESGNATIAQVDTTGVWFQNQIDDKWAFYDKQYHISTDPGPQEIPDWQFIEGYIDKQFDSGIAVLVSGEVTISSSLIKTISRQIILGYSTINGTLGILVALVSDIIDNTSFIIKSLNSNRTINTADTSSVRWCIIGD